MERRRIGTLEVSVVGLGCNNFGGRTDAAGTREVVDAAIDAGITYFDTAEIYNDGRSEELLGAAIGDRRDQVLIATKWGHDAGMPEGERAGDPAVVRRHLEASLRRLGTDRVDHYQLHRPDPLTPVEETLGVLSDLRAEGKLVEIGATHHTAAQLREADAAARARAVQSWASVQNHSSLLTRDPETDGVFEACEELGLAFVPYFPLEAGLLTGKYRLGEAWPAESRLAKAGAASAAHFIDDDRLALVERLRTWAEERGHPLLDLALSWHTSNPLVATVIAGATRPEQVRANVAAAGWALTDADRDEIRALLRQSPRRARMAAPAPSSLGVSVSDVAQQAATPAHAGLATDRLAARAACAGSPSRAVVSPVDGSEVGRVPAGTPQDVAAAAARARAAQVAWAVTPVRRRAAVVRRFGELVLDEQEWLIDLAVAEMGKTRRDAFEEVADIALAARWYAGVAPGVLRPRRVAGYMPVATRTTVLRHPKGLVGVISPWNYPLTLAVSDAMPALLAGNAVLLKPDSQTPFCALALAELMDRAGLPREVLQVVTGAGSVIGDAIVDAVDALMFTGSTATGRHLAERCGARLITFCAELGGKNAMLVLPGADLGRAVEGAVRACFASSGQVCVGIERLHVADAVYDAFVPAFSARAAGLRIGTDWEADLGPLASASQLERVTAHVADAVAKGATVLAGGRARPDLGALVHEPTVLADVTEEMDVAREETFGPVVSVHRFAGAADAAAAVADGRHGLSASVWGPAAQARRVAALLRVGAVSVNDGYAASWASHAAPMGGMQDSGTGRRHGVESLLTWTEPQTVAEQRLVPTTSLPGMTPEGYARFMTAAIRLWAKVPTGRATR